MRDDKLSDRLSYPPRAMRAEQAAAYLSIGRTLFLELVAEGKMPRPVKIKGAATWDRFELDAAFDDLKEEPGENTVHRRLRELEDAEVQNRRKRR
jgi:predicted DNA-binding transcriptional regulator AlpA